jgi:hypothetical protein
MSGRWPPSPRPRRASRLPNPAKRVVGSRMTEEVDLESNIPCAATASVGEDSSFFGPRVCGTNLPSRSVFHLETPAKLLKFLERVLVIFSKCALNSLNNQADFDSAIPWFESRRPSQELREIGLVEVAPHPTHQMKLQVRTVEQLRDLFPIERIAREIQGSRAHGIACEVGCVDFVVYRPELLVRPPHAESVDQPLVIGFRLEARDGG